MSCFKKNSSKGSNCSSGSSATEKKSKTQRKKEALALQKLGEKLVMLSQEQLEEIEMPEEIYESVRLAQSLKKHEARRRQLQYIGSLMRKYDTAPITEAIRNIEKGSSQKAKDFRETEMWRDELMAGNSTLLEEILAGHPDADRQHLSRLIRNAVKEKAAGKSPKSARALFRYLRDIKTV